MRNRFSLRSSSLAVAAALGAGAALRFGFIHAAHPFDGDPLIYGAIARNWLLYGVYGFSSSGSGGALAVSPTLIRLPGYPAFLALCFRIFGVGNYRAVLYLQAIADLAACLLVYAFVKRIGTPRAAQAVLWLAVLCPFTANYTAIPLAETLSVFCVALGLWAYSGVIDRPGFLSIAALIFSCGWAAMLRPEGFLLFVALFAGWLVHGYRRNSGEIMRLAAACALLTLLPFVPWTIRNWRTFHVFQPLAPRTAADPGEFAAPGFESWCRTWLVDFTSTYEVYWNVPGDAVAIDSIPNRAFDNEAERDRTRLLLNEYNRRLALTPSLDDGFASLARERESRHPMRTYLELPLLRLAGMWLRPRLELFDYEPRWWQFSRHPGQTGAALAYGALNLIYLIGATAGFIWNRPRFAGVMAGYVILRSLLLLVVTAPESRYTLECFPILEVFAAFGFTTVLSRGFPKSGRRLVALEKDTKTPLSETGPR